MPTYETVGVRFNIENEIEYTLYNNLNSKNRSGHIKKILKEIFIGKGYEVARQSYIEDIVRNLMLKENLHFNVEKEKKIIESDNIEEIDLLSVVSNIMKGA